MATAVSDARRPQSMQSIQGTRATARTVAVQVTAMRPAARDAVTLTLALPGTRQSPGPFRAGQFITLTIPAASGAPLYRSYSLCGDGRTDAPWQITVKRVPGGKVSNHLIDRIKPGMVLRSSLPQGNFTMTARPHPDVSFVLVAGGSGITPIYAMLRALARLAPGDRPRVALHYAYHSPEDAIFGRELLALDPERAWLSQQHYVSAYGYRLDAAQIVATMGTQAARAHWYVCGPASLRHALQTAATSHGVPASHLHAEVFTSPAVRRPAQSAQGAQSRKAARIRLADSGAVLTAQPGETLLETLERCGYRPDFSCRAGACATCRLKVVAGTVRESGENNVLMPSERARGYVLSCVGELQGDVTLATAGRQVAPPRAASGRATRENTTARLAARRSLRAGVAAATVGVFLGAWGLTHSSTATTASVTSGGSSSDSTSSGSGSATAGSSGSANNGSGSSGSITTQPSLGGSNSSTGTS